MGLRAFQGALASRGVIFALLATQTAPHTNANVIVSRQRPIDQPYGFRRLLRLSLSFVPVLFCSDSATLDLDRRSCHHSGLDNAMWMCFPDTFFQFIGITGRILDDFSSCVGNAVGESRRKHHLVTARREVIPIYWRKPRATAAVDTESSRLRSLCWRVIYLHNRTSTTVRGTWRHKNKQPNSLTIDYSSNHSPDTVTLSSVFVSSLNTST